MYERTSKRARRYSCRIMMSSYLAVLFVCFISLPELIAFHQGQLQHQHQSQQSQSLLQLYYHSVHDSAGGSVTIANRNDHNLPFTTTGSARRSKRRRRRYVTGGNYNDGTNKPTTMTCRSMIVNDDNDDSNNKNRNTDEENSFLNWLSSSSQSGDAKSKKPMVQPIGYDGQPLQQQQQPPPPQKSLREEPRIRPNFGNLFQGMPSLNDIVSSSGSGGSSDDTPLMEIDSNVETETDDDDDDDDDMMLDPSNGNRNNLMGRPKRRRFSTKQVDETWFAKEEHQITSKYGTILKDMYEQIKNERKHDPESVPENAEELMKSVLQQEMEIEIKETKQQRNEERYISYDNITRQQTELDTSNRIASPNPNIQRLMDESEAEYVKQSTSRNELQDFLQYQTMRQNQVQQQQQQPTSPPLPGMNENLDQWALDRLKDMANSRKDTDADEMILDTLQENVNQLENDMRKENEQLSKFKTTDQQQQQPQTMKEWQMYRSIATRIENNEGSSSSSNTLQSSRDDLIMEQLQLWKEYIVKEEGHRKRSGLTRGPKLPFPWQEAVLGGKNEDESSSLSSSSFMKHDKASRIETRKQLNRMAIAAMESLLVTTDPNRRVKLQKEIDYLKATFEANDYLDIDESTFDEDMMQQQQQKSMNDGPVDTTNLFVSSNWPSDDDGDINNNNSLLAWDSSQPNNTPPSNSELILNAVSSSAAASPSVSSYAIDDLDRRRSIPPPKTAFFSSEVEDEEYDLGETFTGDSKLGTMEEQKLEAMFRRAGVNTPEERKVIQIQWEEFRQLEESKRQQSGLSMSDSDNPNNNETKYKIADVMRDDGDFDAATILAAIGPRPVRTKKVTSVSVDDETSEAIPTSTTAIKQEDVIDSLFRSVSAVGGGRYKDDPIAKQQERSSFEEFVLKESRMRESLDDPSLLSRTKLDDVQLPEPSDDTNYAKEVLSSMGPRPTRNSKRTQAMNAREYSDRGGILANDALDDDEDDQDEDDDDTEETDPASKSVESDLVPEWLRKENEEAMKGSSISSSFSGNDIDVVFDNDKYEHNMRQLAEYEKRRKGQSRSMGIDISDVLGRRDSDDYADFKYDDDFIRSRQNDGWSYGTFSNRKANLLDYIELDVQEINALMDHKDSVYSTGVSQYLPRINKPFKEFGAIFRLEGVILEIDGLQLEAWSKVAEEFGLKRPTIDDVKLAAVTRPEIAVKDIFAWSDDFLECRNIASAHRQTFKNVFGTWAKGAGITVAVSPSQASVHQSFTAGGHNREDSPKQVESSSPISENEMLKQTGHAWSNTAKEFGKLQPDDTALLIASTLNPDIAILKVFKWSSDPLEIERMARSYRLNLMPEAKRHELMRSETTVNKDSRNKPTTQTEMMELHYKAWSDVAQKYGFNPPATDEVLAAFVINEPEIAARGFGWSDDPKRLSNIAQDFLAKVIPQHDGLAKSKSIDSNKSLKTSDHFSGTNDSTREELCRVAFDAWSETASSNGFPAPDVDQVQFALSVGPEEAIVSGFEWTTNPAEIVKLLRSYRDAVGRIRGNENKKPIEIQKPIQTPSGPSPDDVYRTVFDSWTAIAKASGFPLPDDEQVQFALSVGAEEAIINGFGWANESTKVAELMVRYKAELAKRRSVWQKSIDTKLQSKKSDDIPMYKVNPGVSQWIKSLLDVEMQCAVVSYLELDQVNTLLELAGVSDLITADKRVSLSNGYVTDTDMLLGAALRVERRPNHCVVFDTTPHSSVAAHDVEMQSVCLIGPYPRYELLSADTTAASFDSLSAINIRRLFSERVYDQPLVEVQTTDPGRNRNTKTRTRFFDDE